MEREKELSTKLALNAEELESVKEKLAETKEAGEKKMHQLEGRCAI